MSKNSHTQQKHPKYLRSRQKGASLLMAVFMIVIFSLLAAAMAKIMSTSSKSLSYEVIGLKALAAAKSGNQWALERIFPLTGAANCQLVVSNPINLSNIPGMQGCEVEKVECQPFTEAEETYYTLISTGYCKVGTVETRRTIQVEARSF